MEKWQQPLALLGLLAVGLGGLLWAWWGRRVRRAVKTTNVFKTCGRGALSLLGGLALAALVGWFWYYHRGQPEPVEETLFPGVTYVREVRSGPHPAVVHVVKIALDTPGLEFVVTPGEPGEKLPLRGATTTEFMRAQQVQLAVNGDFLTPWFSESPWDYYPHRGDPVKVLGVAAAQGKLYSTGDDPEKIRTMYFSAAQEVSLTAPTNGIYNALSGDITLVHGGRVQLGYRPYSEVREPRTALGLTKGGTHLIIVAVDGRQPNYSEGLGLEEVAQILVAHGAEEAFNLDGGGSTTLAMMPPGEEPVLLNCPIHTRIPYRERPIANHLGIRLRGKRPARPDGN